MTNGAVIAGAPQRSETDGSIIGAIFKFVFLGLYTVVSLTGWFLLVVLYAVFWIGVVKLALWLFF